jgi:hypothetical protein
MVDAASSAKRVSAGREIFRDVASIGVAPHARSRASHHGNLVDPRRNAPMRVSHPTAL